MTRRLVIIIGPWKLEDWHLYHWEQTTDARTGGQKARWMKWRKVW